MLIYTEMPPRGTLIMQLLGLPFYLWALFVGLLLSSWFPGAFLVVLFSAYFIYSFVYSKALYFFVHRARSQQSAWFVVGVLGLQTILLIGTWYVAAA